MPRVNDARLLAGAGRYTDDLELPGMLHAAIIRSPVAHGTIRSFDRSELTVPTDLVLGPQDVADRVSGSMPIVWHLEGQFQHDKPVVDPGRVRHVGETLGIVVAGSRAAAEDAVDQVFVAIDELDPVVDPRGCAGTRRADPAPRRRHQPDGRLRARRLG